MKKTLLLVAAISLVAAACGDDDGPAETTPAPTTAAATTATPTTTAAPTTAAPATTTATSPPPTTEAMDGPTLVVAASALGDILTDAEGNTLYLFIPDNQGPSVCTEGCAAAWPPLEGTPTAGAGVDASLAGTTDRPDGTTQATYNGWPLYYYADDASPGDTNGQAVNDVWWVVSPSGDSITDAPDAMAGPVITVSSSPLGDLLTDGDGNTLYLFLPDNQGPSVCTEGCAAVWPPLGGEPMAGDGVDGALLGTVARTDGGLQATYNGWPLYYYAPDTTAGDTNGQAVNDVWWVISPAGDAIM